MAEDTAFKQVEAETQPLNAFLRKAIIAEPECEQLKHAVLVHNQTVQAISNLHELYRASLISRKKGTATYPGEEDLLRAMLLFTCSGLDAVVKQLIKDAIERVLLADEGAQREFKKFVERKLKKGSLQEDLEKTSPSLNISLISELLVSFDARSHLVSTLRRALTSDSLQSVDQLLKVAAHFAITREEIMSKPDDTKQAFQARNQVAHEMDIHLESDNKRRERKYVHIAKWCENLVVISEKFILRVLEKCSDHEKPALDEAPGTIGLDD